MSTNPPAKPKHILLYPCNLVGYARLAMLVMAVIIVYGYRLRGWPLGTGMRLGIAIWLFVTVLLLDVVDGHLARKLNQVTPFGTILDQIIDLIGHTVVWLLSGLTIAPLFIVIEWTAGLLVAAFARQPGHHWKRTLVEEGPWPVRVYFKPVRLNLLNVYSNIGHFVFPISLFVAGDHGWLGPLMLPGLLIFEVVTVYMIYTFFKILVAESGRG